MGNHAVKRKKAGNEIRQCVDTVIEKTVSLQYDRKTLFSEK